jgi:hypothetical protein
MTGADWRMLYFSQVEKFVSEHGFTLDSQGLRFVRRQDDEWSHRFTFVVLEREQGIEVSVHVGIRSETIESIFHLTSGFAEEHQAGTPTLGTDCWRFMPESPRSHLIDDVESLRIAVLDCARLYVRCALPYYAELSSFAAVDRVVNGRLDLPCVHRMFGWFRASTGVIAAKLVRRPDYPALAQHYRDRVAAMHKGFYLARFEALLRRLSDL